MARWIAAGAPEGDPRDLPHRANSPTRRSGHADLVLRPDVPYRTRAPATSTAASASRPRSLRTLLHSRPSRAGNTKIVHHVLPWWIRRGIRRACRHGMAWTAIRASAAWSQDRRLPRRLGPGARRGSCPRGGMLLPKDRVVFQLHYHNRARPRRPTSPSCGPVATAPCRSACSSCWSVSSRSRFRGGGAHEIEAQSHVYRP